MINSRGGNVCTSRLINVHMGHKKLSRVTILGTDEFSYFFNFYFLIFNENNRAGFLNIIFLFSIHLYLKNIKIIKI